MSEAMRSDLNGIVSEIGNAPRNPIQSASYVKPGPFLLTSIVPTSRCSKYIGRLAIGLLHVFGKVRQFGGRGLRPGCQNVARPEPKCFGYQEAPSKLAGRFASLQFDQEPAAHPRCQCKLILAHL